MAGGEHPGDVGGEGPYVVVGRVPVQRHQDVQPPRAGGHEQRRQLQPVQEVAQPPGGVPYRPEPLLGRVEVEDQPVRVVGAVGLRQPPVQGDGALVGEEDQGGRVLGQDVRDGAALLRHLGAPHPVREVVRHVLLEEAPLADAARMALQRQRAAAQVRQHPWGHGAVVLREVGLGDAVLGEQHLLRPADRDGAPARPYLQGLRHRVLPLRARRPCPSSVRGARALARAPAPGPVPGARPAGPPTEPLPAKARG